MNPKNCVNWNNRQCNLFGNTVPTCRSSCFVAKKGQTCKDCDWHDPRFCNLYEKTINDHNPPCSGFKQTPICPSCGSIMFTGSFVEYGVMRHDDTYRCLVCDPKIQAMKRRTER